MKLVILDELSINLGDLSWSKIEEIGDLRCFPVTADDQVSENIGDAFGVFVSKCPITRKSMEVAPNLKFIGVTATGYDNIDINAAKELGIAVCNVPAYSTEAVAQHTFSLILNLTNHVALYNGSVQKGDWYKSPSFTYQIKPLTLLSGKSLGIIGYGNIGKKVARIAEAFGMEVNIYSKDKDAAIKSDFLTLHCPATQENNEFINSSFISQMKDGAVLINTARGALVNESDLAAALKSGKLSAAALDVISTEPPVYHNPLIGLDNCILTPHISWMPKETRQKVIDISAENLSAFLEDKQLNRLV